LPGRKGENINKISTCVNNYGAQFSAQCLRYITAGDGRKLHNEQLHNLYSAPNIISIIKTKRMRRHVACIEEQRNARRILTGNPDGKRSLGRPNICKRIILRWILEG
jgi:hypothetical protein